MAHKKRRSGFTLVEMLACLTFLSLTVYPMLTCITYSIKTALRAQDQMWVEGLIQDSLDAQRAIALTSSLTAGTTTTHPQPTGMSVSVTETTTISLVSGFTNLYEVTVTANWSDTILNDGADTMTVSTYVQGTHA